MRVGLLIFLIAATGLRAQYLIDPSRARRIVRLLEPQPGEQTLRCDVTEMRPVLNFSFRFQAGYLVRVPMEQYFGPGHRWGVVTRITPEEGGQPVYFGNNFRLPDVPKTKNLVEVGGGYHLGEGRYKVRLALADETGRVCRKDWKIEAKLSRGEKRVKVAMPPGSVSDLSLRGSSSIRPATDDAAPVRLTVLMHAAPVSPRRTRMGARDRVMLLGTLSSLLERLPTKSVRLVVFNLDQQKELYRQDDFKLESFDQVAQSIAQIELGLVDMQVLQNRGGHVALLSDLVNRELAAPEPSDVVLFLGPMSRYFDKVPDSWIEKPSGAGPQFFYLQTRSIFPQMQSVLPDTISSAVSRLRGKTLIIRMPGEFAKAIEQLEKRAGPRMNSNER
jgi:hypothetical protein